ncbi:hypothetical protein [Gynuella sp.]|uniref:hypothetical protein n=1 Tax=Gynuella sp. TaxID=2969146 RepID=UPI003D14A898
MKGISLVLLMIAMAFVSYLVMEDGQQQGLMQVDNAENKAEQIKQQVNNIEKEYAQKLKDATN